MWIWEETVVPLASHPSYQRWMVSFWTKYPISKTVIKINYNIGDSEWCWREFRKKTLFWWIIHLTFAAPSYRAWSISTRLHLSKPGAMQCKPGCKNISPGIKQRARMAVINTLLLTPNLYMAEGILCQLRSSAQEFIFHAPKSFYLASKEFESYPSITFTLSLQLCTVSYNQETKLKGLFFF